MYRVLVVDDDEQMRMALSTTLKHMGYDVTAANDAQKALKLLKKENFDVILSDLKMPKINGIEFLKEARKLTGAPVIIITAFGTIETAVESMKLGAFDFILKPFSADALKKVIELAISHSSASKNMIKSDIETDADFIVASERMKEILKLAYKVAKTDATVLLLGESGTGKEILARYIHSVSSRSKGNFVAINCAAIPENLLESELFGYERGAFSGATRTHKGKFEQANGGTLLLDEITEMPLSLQAKILRVLQEKTIDRLGSNESIPVNVRIICTTNRNIEEEVKESRFREDLFYRINVFPITIPPLRERKEDIAPLANLFLKRYSRAFGKKIKSISDQAMEILQNYSWPGNVRELENVIERAVVLCESREITQNDIFLHNL